MGSLYSVEKTTAKLIKAVFDTVVMEPLSSSEVAAKLNHLSDTATIKNVVRNMMRRGEIRPRANQRLAELELTEKGGERHRKLKLLSTLGDFNRRLKSESWDGKWRILIYDIPEAEHHLRDMIRRLISEIGLYQYQRSVWITPYNCRPQIDMIKEIYGEKSSDITLIEADRFGADAELVSHFGL